MSTFDRIGLALFVALPLACVAFAWWQYLIWPEESVFWWAFNNV